MERGAEQTVGAVGEREEGRKESADIGVKERNCPRFVTIKIVWFKCYSDNYDCTNLEHNMRVSNNFLD